MKYATVRETVEFLLYFNCNSTSRPTNFSARMLEGHQTAILEVAGVWYSLHDNGGEFMVEKLNSGEPARAVPLNYFGGALNVSTVASRVAMVLRDEYIDYDDRMTDEEEEILRETV